MLRWELLVTESWGDTMLRAERVPADGGRLALAFGAGWLTMSEGRVSIERRGRAPQAIPGRPGAVSRTRVSGLLVSIEWVPEQRPLRRFRIRALDFVDALNAPSVDLVILLVLATLIWIIAVGPTAEDPEASEQALFVLVRDLEVGPDVMPEPHPWDHFGGNREICAKGCTLLLGDKAPKPRIASQLTRTLLTAPSGMSAEVVETLFHRRRARLLACWKRSERHGDASTGLIAVGLDVRADGAVDRTRIDGAIGGNEAIDACLLRAYGELRFPALSGASQTHVVDLVRYGPP